MTTYATAAFQIRKALNWEYQIRTTQTDVNGLSLTLSLFMLRVFTDNSDATLSFNDFAFVANRFN